MNPPALRNALTIDVEDYFQASALSGYVQRRQWAALPSRVEPNVERILAILEQRRVKATFFTLGWIARRYPQVVRAIADQGHELASHGFSHHRSWEHTRVQFKRDLVRSKCLLEDLSGQAVLGYRAPGFSLRPDNRWAIETLFHSGYRYSSSMYPTSPHGGLCSAGRFAFFPTGAAGLLELPPTTVRLAGRNIAAGGGATLRRYPYALSRWLLRRVNQLEQQPCIYYLRAWELDAAQPHLREVPLGVRLRHFNGMASVEARLLALTRDFAWDRIDNIFPVLPRAAPAYPSTTMSGADHARVP